MTRTEYTDRVLSVMRHPDSRERETIRAELDAHMEDHICALLDMDYPEELAEERTLALMGDPEEVGRAMDKEYAPVFWDAVWGLSRVLLVVLVLWALTGFGILFHAADYLEACFSPNRRSDTEFVAAATEETGYRTMVGNDIVKVYQVAVGELPVYNEETGEKEPVPAVEVLTCAYDRVPFGIVSGSLFGCMTLENQQGQQTDTWGGGTGSYGAAYKKYYLPIDPGDDHVTLRYDRFGERVVLEIPLPEVTA